MSISKDQMKLLADLKASRERGAASMSCGQRLGIAAELEKMKLVELHSGGYGYRITDKGMKVVR